MGISLMMTSRGLPTTRLRMTPETAMTTTAYIARMPPFTTPDSRAGNSLSENTISCNTAHCLLAAAEEEADVDVVGGGDL